MHACDRRCYFTSLGDLTGIFVLRGVMDTAWLEHSNHVLDRYEHDPARAWSATDVVAEREGGAAALLSTQQQYLAAADLPLK